MQNGSRYVSGTTDHLTDYGLLLNVNNETGEEDKKNGVPLPVILVVVLIAVIIVLILMALIVVYQRKVKREEAEAFAMIPTQQGSQSIDDYSNKQSS
eukprot:TRINITY_DN7601_c0_g1_i1.p1 TRINITY_DN7601_c0_g1~~TRINITY_DN7601_c0_g1_i1.p1  ORF type:complete len:113 (-),score=32.15 TRINITY_DN7601_c0_g1_i1:16-306(-)